MVGIGSATDTRGPGQGDGPSFKSRLLEGFKAFGEQATDCAAGVSSGLTPANVPPPFRNEQTHALCKALGAGAGIVGDAFLGASGMAEVGGGAALSATGVGAVAGVPVAAAGVAQIGVAAAGTVVHTKNLSDAITQMSSASNAGGSGGAQEKEQVRNHSSGERARNKALDEVGDLGHDKKATTGRLGEAKDQINGYQSADGKRGFRLDFDEKKGIHYNWYDWTNGNRGTGGRWGAETFPGDKQTYLKMLEGMKK